jgi:hypothetical protein
MILAHLNRLLEGKKLVRPRRFRPRLEVLEARALPATIHWANPAGGSWTVAANWDLQRLPAADDDVVIDAPGNYSVTHAGDSGETEIRSLFSTRPFTLARGALAIHEAARVQNLFLMTGGTLRGATLAPGTTLQARGGYPTLRDVTLGGNLDVGPNTNLTLAGGWRNDGVLTQGGGTLSLGGNFTLAALGDFRRAGGTVNLTGTLDNAGTTLALSDATGPWQLAGGAIVGGTVTTAGGARLRSAGRLPAPGRHARRDRHLRQHRPDARPQRGHRLLGADRRRRDSRRERDGLPGGGPPHRGRPQRRRVGRRHPGHRRGGGGRLLRAVLPRPLPQQRRDHGERPRRAGI